MASKRGGLPLDNELMNHRNGFDSHAETLRNTVRALASYDAAMAAAVPNIVPLDRMIIDDFRDSIAILRDFEKRDGAAYFALELWSDLSQLENLIAQLHDLMFSGSKYREDFAKAWDRAIKLAQQLIAKHGWRGQVNLAQFSK